MGSVIFFGLCIITSLLVALIKWLRKDDADVMFVYLAIFFSVILSLTFLILSENRRETRTGILQFESARQTIKDMTKNKIENAGIYAIIVEKNIWLATQQERNKHYWGIGDLSTDDAIDDIEPITLDN